MPWRDVAVVVVVGAAFALTALSPWCGRDADVPVDRLVTDIAAIAAASHHLKSMPGDTVIVHPPWRDDVERAVRQARVFPDAADVTVAFTHPQGAPWPAITMVAIDDAPWPASLERRRRTLGVDVITRGNLRLFRLPAGSNAEQGQGTAEALPLADAVVEVRTADGRTVPCPFQPAKQRHVCAGLPQWMYVGPEQLLIDGQQQACTWAHPTTNGTVTIRWKNPPPTGALRLAVALSDAAADNPTGAPVKATLTRGSGAPQSVTVHHQHGFQSADLAAGEGPITLTLTTTNDGQRHTCFRLTAAAP